MLDNINGIIYDNVSDVHSVLDIFAGTGVVSQNFKRMGWRTMSNDFLYFSYVMTRGTIALNEKPSFQKLGIDNPIVYLNNLRFEDAGIDLADCFIRNNYSPNDQNGRMYFQPENALKIDVVRIMIERWKSGGLIDEDAYFYLLSSLLNAVPYVANIAGVYAAYLKFWDKRTYNALELKDPMEEGLIFSNGKQNSCYNKDFHEVLDLEADLLYADPPYNEREYLPNYHILETIARYDNPNIHGVTGIRNYDNQRSPFCSKRNVRQAFVDLLSESKCRYILISYNSDGLISTDELCALCEKFAVNNSFRFVETEHRRYKSKRQGAKPALKEQLYFLQRHE